MSRCPSARCWLAGASLLVFLVSAASPLNAQGRGKLKPPPDSSGPSAGIMTEGNGIVVTTIPSVDPHRQPNSGPYNVTFTVENVTKNDIAVYADCTTAGPMTCGNLTWTGGIVPRYGSVNVGLTYSTTSGSGAGGVTLVIELDIGTPPTSWATRSVTVLPPGAGVIQPMAVNENVDRGLCLTTGAGEGGGLSCGDLFLVEGMPAYRTLGKDRSLALHYNSATATGLTLVPAWIREPATIATPSSVQVVLTVGGQADTTVYSLPGQNCGYVGCADSFQVVVGRNLNWAALATGSYDASLKLRNIYPTSIHDAVVNFPLVVVDRSESEYGRGWSLLGIEQLFDTTHATLRTWTAGDGSARVYRRGVGLSSGMLSQSGLTTFSAVGATDGSIGSTGWTTDASSAGAWVRVDLGTAQTVTTLAINAEPGTSNAIYNVQYSDNASTWKTAFTGLRPIGGAWRQVTWASVGAHRYWRLYLTNAPGSGSPISELSFGGVNVFYGAPGDAPDSLVRFDSAGVQWTRRHLKHGANVTFDAEGLHAFTTNRVGHRTTMTWDTTMTPTRLTGIRVPPNDLTNREYVLSWNSTTGRLNYIQDPGGRQLTTVMSGDKLVKVRSPGGLDSTRFAYDARGVLNKRIATRQHLSTKGDSATTTYSYGNNARVTQVSIQADSAATAFATTTILPWEEKGLTTPLVLDTLGLATRINGPITGNGDVVDIWVDRFGQPRRITQVATNAVTRIWRDSVQTLPALVTRIDYPHPTTGGVAGRTARLSWNARGNLVSQRDSTSHLGTIGLPTKGVAYTYGDAANPDSPTEVADALDRTVTYVYNGLGLTASVTDQRAHQTSFTYVASGHLTGLLTQVTEHDVHTWASPIAEPLRDQHRNFAYDANGNLKTDALPHGVSTLYVRNALGQVDAVYDFAGIKREFTYDALGRVTTTKQYTAPSSIPGGIDLLEGCDTVAFICTADSTREVNSGIASSLTTTYVQSPSGVTSITDPRGVDRSWRYGARGEVRAEIDDYGVGTVATHGVAGMLDSVRTRVNRLITYTYDSLGRRATLTYPDVISGNRTTNGGTLTYTYDRLSRLTNATGGHADVRRWYFADGTPMAAASSGVAGYDSLSYRWDAAGARTHLTHKDVLGVIDSLRYAYDTAGDLDSLIVKWGGVTGGLATPRVFRFDWDQLGRRRKVIYPATASSMSVNYLYDALGTLRHLRVDGPPEPSSGQSVLDIDQTMPLVDAGGRILEQHLVCDGFETPGSPCGDVGTVTTKSRYNRLGWLVSQVATGPRTDSLRYDGSGNIIWRRPDQLYPAQTFNVSATHNRIESIVRSGEANRYITYHADGSRDSETKGTASYRKYFYDGLGRTGGLLIFEGYNDYGLPQIYDDPNSCFYDALGRQVKACAGTAARLGLDGENIIRAENWALAQGPGLDDPLVALARGAGIDTRELYHITDGQGRHYATAGADGSMPPITDTYGYIGWDAAGAISASHSFNADRLERPSAPGLSFFRNRVYDQETGRWTQEDPIGVAGGINLYEFTGNNPVAYTDPFGLCVPFCAIPVAASSSGVGAAGVALIGGALLAGSEITAKATVGVLTLAGSIVATKIDNVVQMTKRGLSTWDRIKLKAKVIIGTALTEGEVQRRVNELEKARKEQVEDMKPGKREGDDGSDGGSAD